MSIKLNYKTVCEMVFESMLLVKEDKTSLQKATVMVKQAAVLNNIQRAKLVSINKTSPQTRVEFYED